MDVNALGAFVGGIDPAARAQQIQQSGDGLAADEREALQLLGANPAQGTSQTQGASPA